MRDLEAVPMLLKCAATPDVNNPGIKEHAVLCLKMLWEGEGVSAHEQSIQEKDTNEDEEAERDDKAAHEA